MNIAKDPLDYFVLRSFLLERDVYMGFLEICCAAVGSDIGYLHLFNEETQELRLNVWTRKVLEGCTSSHDGHYPLRNAGIWADCLRERRTVVHNDYSAVATAPLPEGHFQITNHASFPVWEVGRIIAIVGIGEVPGGFTDAKINEVERTIRIGWPLVEDRLQNVRQRKLNALQRYNTTSPYRILEGMIRSITGALELRDEYTAHHQQNVAHLSGLIADAVELSSFERTGLVIGASLHDIGKIALPSAVLAKPGSISNAEYLLLKTHSEIGAGLFSHMELPWPVTDMIMQHHERLDGSGYPHGLERHDICEGARIIAVADTYDAMSSDRPYRRARGTDAAMEALREGRGQLYDSYLVDAFLGLAERDPSFGGRYLV